MNSSNFSSGLYDLVCLQSFTVFPEYFISISALYVLIVLTLISNNKYLIITQKLSECLFLILLMSCYLIFNDDISYFSVLRYEYPFDLPWLENLGSVLSFNSALQSDALSFFAKIVVCFFSACYFLLISDSFKEQKITSFEYLIVVLLAVIGLLLMCNCQDLLTAYLAIEFSSLASYILASFRKTSSYSVDAGIKYFVTGAISSAFFLFGSSLIYGFTGSLKFDVFIDFFERADFSNLISEWDQYFGRYLLIMLCFYLGFEDCTSEFDPMHIPSANDTVDYSFIEIGLAFILFSILIKLSVAPFHLWSLDVYEGSPTNSTIFFAVISKFSLFVLLIRVCHGCFLSFYDSWSFYTLSIGAFSIFVGALGGLRQRKLKTLIAYSATGHMGYCLLAFGTGSVYGLEGLFFYLIVYMLSGLSIWSIMLSLRLKQTKNSNKYNKELGHLSLLRKTNRSIAFAFSVTMFSMAGMPPLLGFLAKIGVFLPMMKLEYFSIGLLSLLLSVISTFYYIRIVKVIYFENLLIGELYHSVNGYKTLILSISAFLLIFIFINPTFLYLINDRAVLGFSFNF